MSDERIIRLLEDGLRRVRVVLAFATRAAAERHERAVQFFKRGG